MSDAIERNRRWNGTSYFVVFLTVTTLHILAWLLIVNSTRQAGVEGSTPIKNIEFVYSDDPAIPTIGWHKATARFHDFFEVANEQNANRKTLWVRLQFKNDHKSSEELAFLTTYTSERYSVFLNNQYVFQNTSFDSERTFASFAPAIVKLPDEHLRPGVNTISIRLESDIVWCLGIGDIWLGPYEEIGPLYKRLFFWQFFMPQLLNGIMAALTLCILLIWWQRPQEKAFFWLFIVGATWFLRNLHYAAETPVIDAWLLWEIAVNCLFLLMFSFFGFIATFLNIDNRKRWIKFSAVATATIIGLRYLLLMYGTSDALAFLFMAPLTLILYFIFILGALKGGGSDNAVMLVAMTIAFVYSFHDFGFVGKVWTGVGFQIQPGASLIVFGAFLFSLGRRVLFSFGAVENQNAELERRVGDANQKLLVSERARQELEIQSALESERERMTREMHDRIGSNLISALRVAEQRGDPPDVVKTLKGSLVDLRLTVDSLEPMEGDVGLLLASFRHRTEVDLNQAGLKFEWHVEQVPPLIWLDAVNALHLLRVLQQSLANTLAHSGSSKVRMVCKDEIVDGRRGVLIEMSDNGAGFQPSLASSGKGIKNMESRILSIGGDFKLNSEKGKGVTTAIWLPLIRPS